MDNTFSLEALELLDNHQERQRLTIDQFNHAMETEDFMTAQQIAHYVINHGDMSNKIFSSGWQMHCLNWLTAYYFNQWRNTEDDSAEDEKALKNILECLWEFKWIVGKLPSDLNESREDIKQAAKQMSDLYKEFDFSPAMVEKAMMEQAMLMGNAQAAQIHFKKWQKYAKTKDNMQDCLACETNSLIQYHHFMGHFTQVVALAAPILSGEMHCAEVPHTTYYPVIDSLIQLKDHERAREYLEEAIDLIKEEEAFLPIMSHLIQMVNQLNDKEWASSLLDEFSEPIVDAIQNNRLDYLEYLFAVAPLNDDALFAARALAKEFDARNDNRYYQNKLALMFTPPTIH